jgi:hypothetical protein
MPQTPISITTAAPCGKSASSSSSKSEADAPLSAKGNRRDLMDHVFADQKPLVMEGKEAFHA